MGFIFGFRSIEEALAAAEKGTGKSKGRLRRLLVFEKKLTGRERGFLNHLRQSGSIPIESMSLEQYKGFNDQAFVAEVHASASDSLRERSGSSRGASKDIRELDPTKEPLVVALDGIQDPHNLGAIIRSCAFFGVKTVLLPKDRAVGVTPTVSKVASGGLEHVDLIEVGNLVQAFDVLKERGYWIVGFSERGRGLEPLKDGFATVVVIGNEEKGMRPLVEDNCDLVFSLPAAGHLSSLNASVAAAMVMAWGTRYFQRV